MDILRGGNTEEICPLPPPPTGKEYCGPPSYDARGSTAKGSAHLGGLVIHDLLHHEIALVSDQQLVHLVGRVLVDLVQPRLDVVEAFLGTGREGGGRGW